jgi:hypothetical protein
MRVPTKQLEEYADKYEFGLATRRFSLAIVRRSKGYYQPFLVNLHHLNDEIGKTRSKGKYVRGTLLNVKNDLFDSPSFKVMRQHSAYVFEIQIVPFFDNQKIVQTEEILTDENVETEEHNLVPESNAEFLAEDTGIDQQQLIYTDQKCRSVGVVFQKEDLWKIAKYPKELINLAINSFKSAEMAQGTFIRNPAGWLIRCLEKKYYLSYRAEKYVSSAAQKLFELQDWFLENVGSLPKRGDFARGMPIPSQ